MKKNNRMNISLLAASVMSLAAVSAFAVVPDGDSGYRDNPSSNPSGQAVVVKADFDDGDDEGTLYRREANGTENKIHGVGDVLVPTNATTGIGSNPVINANGVVAAKISLTTKNLDYSSGENNYEDGAIVTGTPGDVDVIAKTLDTRDGQVICNIEPFPQINSSDEVFFGTTTQVADGFCAEDGGYSSVGGGGAYPWANKRITSRKGIYRYTPEDLPDPASTDLLLLAGMPVDGADGGTDPDQFDPMAASVTTSNPNWVSGETTFSVIDAHLIAHGGRSVTSDGNALATAWFTDVPTVTSAQTSTTRRGFLYLTDSGHELVSMADRDDTYSPVLPGTRFTYHDKAYADNDSNVYFKTETDGSTNDADDQAYLNRWVSGAGVSATPFLQTDDQPSGSSLYVNGYAPHIGFNDDGIVALMAGLTNGADGNTITVDCRRNTTRMDYCQGIVRISNSGATKSLVARTYKTLLVDAGGSAASFHEVNAGDCDADRNNDTADCFRFDSLGSVAMVTDSGNVIFVAYDSLTDSLTSDGSGGYEGSGISDRSGIFKWSTDGSITRLIAEGDTIDAVPAGSGSPTVSVSQDSGALLAYALKTGLEWAIEPANAQPSLPVVMRIYTPMPELRQMTASNGAMSLRVWLDTTGNSEADTDAIVQIAGEDTGGKTKSGGGSVDLLMLMLLLGAAVWLSTTLRTREEQI